MLKSDMMSRTVKRKWCSEPVKRSNKVPRVVVPPVASSVVKRKWRQRPTIDPSFRVKNLNDLLFFAWNYTGDDIDWFMLWRLIPPLTELSRMIGMEDVKQAIVDLVLYYVQGMNTQCEDGDMLHTVLSGPPGVGKTQTAKILAKIYCGLGFLTTDNVIIAKRTDFVGKYIGHSEAKTIELLEKAKGGVLFIDEAYSMGSKDKTDSFAKAAVDLLNGFLTENKKNFVCIIAGYEKELEESFFSINPGLQRRFPWRFSIKPHTPEGLLKIFEQKIRCEHWSLDSRAVGVDFFVRNRSDFPYSGGDIETLFSRCKIYHTRRVFGSNEKKKLLTAEDVNGGYQMYKSQRQSPDTSHEFMYI